MASEERLQPARSPVLSFSHHGGVMSASPSPAPSPPLAQGHRCPASLAACREGQCSGNMPWGHAWGHAWGTCLRGWTMGWWEQAEAFWFSYSYPSGEQSWTFLQGTTWFRGEAVLKSHHFAHFNTEGRAGPHAVPKERGWKETQEM